MKKCAYVKCLSRPEKEMQKAEPISEFCPIQYRWFLYHISRTLVIVHLRLFSR